MGAGGGAGARARARGITDLWPRILQRRSVITLGYLSRRKRTCGGKGAGIFRATLDPPTPRAQYLGGAVGNGGAVGGQTGGIRAAPFITALVVLPPKGRNRISKCDPGSWEELISSSWMFGRDPLTFWALGSTVVVVSSQPETILDKIRLYPPFLFIIPAGAFRVPSLTPVSHVCTLTPSRLTPPTSGWSEPVPAAPEPPHAAVVQV